MTIVMQEMLRCLDTRLEVFCFAKEYRPEERAKFDAATNRLQELRAAYPRRGVLSNVGSERLPHNMPKIWNGGLAFDLRRDQAGGYSGGIVMQDDLGSISFVSGNSTAVDGRHYVLVNYHDFRLTCDRADFPSLTREDPIGDWYIAAIKVLISKLGPIEFIGLVDAVHANGKQIGAEDAREEIRSALGIQRGTR